MTNTEHFIRHVTEGALEIANQTVAHFGEERANQFTQSSADGMHIQLAIVGYYRQEQLMNLVHAQASAMLKELRWLQFLFLAGNYPLVNGRLRYLWEAVYRACWVETHEDAAVRGLDLDRKLEWIEGHATDWNRCIRPALERLLPLVKREREVFDHYHGLWKQLNQYVHPSERLQSLMVRESSLLIKDAFDAEWAEETLQAAKAVTDLVWLAVLTCHEKAIAGVREENMSVGYPLTSMLLRRGCALT